MSIAYAITTGSYSDYRVDCIFERQEDAEEFLKKMMDNDMRVEKFDFHPANQIPNVYTEYFARCWPKRSDEIRQIAERTTVKPRHTPLEDVDSNFVYFSCSGPDKERCLKSVSDRVAKWKADQAGIV
jgi:hypothetical protein